MVPREGWDEYFMQMAFRAAARSTCPRLNVGGVLVQNKRVRATGYNGSPPSSPHCIDVGCLMDNGHCVRTVHMEQNIIEDTTRAQRAGSVLYSTDVTCLLCTDRVVRGGIAEVVYARPYRKYEDIVAATYHENGIVFRQYMPILMRLEETLKTNVRT